jgi:hypothetical protein
MALYHTILLMASNGEAGEILAVPLLFAQFIPQLESPSLVSWYVNSFDLNW